MFGISRFFIWNVDLNLYLSSIEIKAQRTTNNPSSKKRPAMCWYPQRPGWVNCSFFKRLGAPRYFLKMFFVEPVGNDLLNIPSFKSFPSFRSQLPGWTFPQNSPISGFRCCMTTIDLPTQFEVAFWSRQEKYGKIRSIQSDMMQMNANEFLLETTK